MALFFSLACSPPSDCQAEVGTVERRNEDPGLVEVQLSDDIFTGNLVGCGRKGHNRHPRKLLVQHAQLRIFRTEIVSPLRDAMCFVNGKERNVHVSQQVILFGKQLFR